MARYLISALIAESCIMYASVLIKIINLPPILSGFYRVALALPIFCIIAYMHGGLKVGLKNASLMILAGVFFGLDLVCFNTALHRTSVANVNLLSSLVCFILVPIGVIFFKEKINYKFIIGSIVAVGGLFMLLGGRSDDSVAHISGDALAFLACCSYSIFLAFVYSFRKRYNAVVLMFYAGIGSSILLLLAAGILEDLRLPNDEKTWMQILLIMLFGQILGQGFFGYIMGKISTQASSLILLISPIIAAIMGYLILGEKLGIFEILGIFIILGGTYIAKKSSS